MGFILRLLVRRLLAYTARRAIEQRRPRLHPAVTTLGLLALELL